MTAALEIRDLRARYGQARILDGVSLAVDRGEALAIIGRNGAGKTTTLMSVFAIPVVDGGEVLVDGVSMNRRRPTHAAARRGVAISPQGRRIVSGLSVRENLLVGGASGRSGPWTVDSVTDLFPALGEKIDAPGTSLSGGQQQMLAIGRALMSNPSVLLLDEPSEGLSPVLVDDLAAGIPRIQAEGSAVVLVEQHLDLMARVCQSYVVLEKGASRSSGRMSDLDQHELRAMLGMRG